MTSPRSEAPAERDILIVGGPHLGHTFHTTRPGDSFQALLPGTVEWGPPSCGDDAHFTTVVYSPCWVSDGHSRWPFVTRAGVLLYADTPLTWQLPWNVSTAELGDVIVTLTERAAQLRWVGEWLAERGHRLEPWQRPLLEQFVVGVDARVEHRSPTGRRQRETQVQQLGQLFIQLLNRGFVEVGRRTVDYRVPDYRGLAERWVADYNRDSRQPSVASAGTHDGWTRLGYTDERGLTTWTEETDTPAADEQAWPHITHDREPRNFDGWGDGWGDDHMPSLWCTGERVRFTDRGGELGIPNEPPPFDWLGAGWVGGGVVSEIDAALALLEATKTTY